MSRLARVLTCAAALVAEPVSLAHAADDPLAKARLLYNQRQFEAAVNAAEQARLLPQRADAADLVAARAYLERFRASYASDDLTNARDRLRRLDPQRLAPRERAEYVLGLAEALYLDGGYGAAASMFDSILNSGDLQAAGGREKLLDWWADALDHDARPRPDIDRQPMYRRIRARMEDEISARPGSATASYWLASAARSQGDLQAAWDAAQAGWLRAPLAIDHGAQLRDDLDRLMMRGIIPERAKATGQPPLVFQAEWDRFKERWKR
jgi:hypothetical protein